MTRDEAKEYIRTLSPFEFLDKDNQGKGFICPNCGNGSGRKGDGIRKNPHNPVIYKCFRCGEAMDIYELIGHRYNLSSFPDKFEKALEIYQIYPETGSGKNIPVQRITASTASSGKTIPPFTSFPALCDVSDYINLCHSRADETSYFKSRHISRESIDRFNLGYDPHCTESTGQFAWKAVIIPTSSETYEIRNTAVGPNSSEKSAYKYRKHGPNRIFNLSALHEDNNRPVFVCEGAIDAISVIQCGAQAIGLGSANNYPALLNELSKFQSSKPIILLLDSDDAGKLSTEALKKELEKLGLPYLEAGNVTGIYHDPNDRLINDEEGLKKEIAEAEKRAECLLMTDSSEKADHMRSSAALSLNQFKRYISNSREAVSSGFKSIDNVLNGGFTPSLYIIGAVSSLGKTTLTLQIADHIAQTGNDVLFFSLEQSKYEMMSKSISRESFRYCRTSHINTSCAKTNSEILKSADMLHYSEKEKAVFSRAFEIYESYAGHMFFYEETNDVSVEDIRNYIQKHILFTGCSKPVVIIDYLQILKAPEGFERSSDKQITDHNVKALKQLSREFDIPVIVVSSLNRQSYSGEIEMSAFKESGAIEYGSDVLIGLQFKGAGQPGFDIKKEKARVPRNVEFLILKNRNGNITEDGISISYYQKFNYFE